MACFVSPGKTRLAESFSSYLGRFRRCLVVITRGSQVLSASQTAYVEDRSEHNCQDKVDYNCRKRRVHGRKAQRTDRYRIHRLEIRSNEHERTENHCHEPTDKQCPAIEPVGVEAQEDGRQRLEYPDTTEQLEVNDLRRGNIDDKEQGSKFHYERGPLGHSRFLAVAGVFPDVGFVYIPGEQISCCNRHDCSGNQRANRDGSERKACKPGWERGVD